MNALVDALTEWLPPPSRFPSGIMEPLEPFLSGTAFFPGGSGLFGGPAQPVPSRPIMVVGQDFGTRDYVAALRVKNARDESMDATWRVLLDTFLRPNGVDPASCFFTNALVGVRCKVGITDANPALDDDGFMGECETFMLDQARLVRPSVVIALGVVPATLLARWFGIDASLPLPRSAKRPTIASIDGAGLQFRDQVEVPGPDIHCAFGWSIHPANAGPNLKWRRWPAKQAQGAAANDLVWRCAAAARARVALR